MIHTYGRIQLKKKEIHTFNVLGLTHQIQWDNDCWIEKTFSVLFLSSLSAKKEEGALTTDVMSLRNL